MCWRISHCPRQRGQRGFLVEGRSLAGGGRGGGVGGGGGGGGGGGKRGGGGGGGGGGFLRHIISLPGQKVTKEFLTTFDFTIICHQKFVLPCLVSLFSAQPHMCDHTVIFLFFLF